MQVDINISIVLGSILSVLFSLIAFFVRALHADFRKMELNLSEIKIDLEVIKANTASESSRSHERFSVQERRIEQLENHLLKHKEYEKR